MKAWNRTLIAVVSCIALANLVAACGDDDKKTTTDTTQVQDTNTTDTVVNDTTVADSTETDTLVADTTPTPTNQCMNTADGTRLQDTTKPEPAKIAEDCGRSGDCLAKAIGGDYAGFETCTVTCMTDGTTTIDAAELSAGCTACFAASVRCTAEKCLQQCLQAGPACDTCRTEKGCISSFFACSGLTPPSN